MQHYLVIIESPYKAPAINSYLGKEYKVVASVGHVRDLPKSTLGVDTDHDFAVKYINIKGKTDIINQLKKEVKNADKVYFATDPDREGEAISWHLATVLGIKPEEANRVTFNDITKKTVLAGMEHPRAIDMNLVNSQQARRILDRIVGYKISPYLWKTVRSGLSAGRVQSVATRIIVEREAEIKAFVPKEYWTIEATLRTPKRARITAKFFGDKNGKIELSCEADAKRVTDACENGEFTVSASEVTKKHRSPNPPFITSTLQQEASKRLGFQSKRTMLVAQELYEGINLGAENGGTHGLITYMRTDSLRVSDEAAEAAKNFIIGKYGSDCYPSKRRVFKSNASAQDAHEAIRPADLSLPPEKVKSALSSDQYKLYKLIWDRFIASQMKNAELEVLSADISCGEYIFKSSEYVVSFRGYMLAYDDTDDELQPKTKLPELPAGDALTKEELSSKQNFTDPPAHYTEGSLIKFLEEKGIGRPSTYAQTITTIVQRGYVKREKKALVSTPLGEATVKLMKKNFPEIVDYKFTASVEEDLDKIARGEETMTEVLGDFYGDFSKTLEKAQESIKDNKVKVPDEESDIICEKCGRKMVIKHGRFGTFAACPGYPECKNTKAIDKKGNVIEKKTEEPEKTDMKCEKCGGDIVIRSSSYGRFYACSNFPKCRYTKAILEPVGVRCPKCGSDIVKAYGKKKNLYYRCEKYPECDFSSWDLPTAEKCPKCGKMLFEKKGKGLYCADAACGYKDFEDKK